MKKLAVLLALVMAAGAGLAKAAELESLKNSSDISLDSIQNSLDGLVKEFHGGPSFGGPGGHNPPPPPNHGGFNPGHGGHNPPPPPNHGGWNPGHGGHNPPPPPPPQPWNPGHGGHYPPPPPPPQPWNPHPGPYPHPGPFPPPQPWNPHPGPFPPPPPVPHYQQVRFDSDRFMWSTDASRSLSEAVRDLQMARIPVLEQRLNYDSYTLVFEVRYGVRVERYNSMFYNFSSDLERAANDFVMQQRSRGMVVLQKNLNRNSFTVSYFDPR